MKPENTDAFVLKELTERDGPLLTGLYDFPLPQPQADRMAARLAAGGTAMLVMRGREVQGIIEEKEGWIGYRIRRDCRGRGAASAAVHQLLQKRRKTVWAKAAASNAASRRVLEKNGFLLQEEKDGICLYVRRFHENFTEG